MDDSLGRVSFLLFMFLFYGSVVSTFGEGLVARQVRRRGGIAGFGSFVGFFVCMYVA